MHVDFVFGPDWDFERKMLHIGRLVLANQVEIKEKLDQMSTEQDKIDADVGIIKGITEGLTTAQTNILAEIEALKAAANTRQPLDFSALDAAVEGLQPIANNIEGIAPIPVVATEAAPVVEAPVVEAAPVEAPIVEDPAPPIAEDPTPVEPPAGSPGSTPVGE